MKRKGELRVTVCWKKSESEEVTSRDNEKAAGDSKS